MPGSGPAGNYVYHGYVGDYPGTIWDEDSFPFTKSAIGDGHWYEEWFNTGESFPGEEAVSQQPSTFNLLQVSPNPFNPTTAIGYQLSADSHIRLEVFDSAGRLVTTLVDGWGDAGTHEVYFNASLLPSGIYLARLTAGDFSEAQKLVLLKRARLPTGRFKVRSVFSASKVLRGWPGRLVRPGFSLSHAAICTCLSARNLVYYT